jgi:hypothetical protein
MLQDYTLVCEDAYLIDIDLKPIVNQTQTALHLHSVGLMRVNKIQNSPSGKVLKGLFDTGSDKTLINTKSALPKQAIPAKDKDPPNITGLHDTKPLDRYVMLEGMHFPEFSPTTKVAKLVKASVFNYIYLSYDVIIGMDVLQPSGFEINCSTLTICWNENTIPFRPANYFDDKQLFNSISAFLDDEEALDNAGYRTKSILSSKYEEVKVARQQKHLSQRQQQTHKAFQWQAWPVQRMQSPPRVGTQCQTNQQLTIQCT